MGNPLVPDTFLKPTVQGIADLPPACLIGLIGAGIQKSRSAGMQIRECTRQGLRYFYNLIDTDKLKLGQQDLPDLIAGAERMGFNGLAITYPFKQTVIPLLTELSPDAQAMGAVNTILFRDGKRIGHNTDWYGFYTGFQQVLPDVPKRRVVQLGAGGAGAAVAYAGLKLGFDELRIFDVDQARAAREVDHLAARFGADRVTLVKDLAAAMADADGLVNCTPIGMDSHPGMALPKEMLRPDLWVFDIVYFPLDTELLVTARKLGCRTASGMSMVIWQAVEQIRLYTGLTANADRMQDHFLNWEKYC
jgi:shikimate dehydrogenase